MLLSAVSFLVFAQSSSEVPEDLWITLYFFNRSTDTMSLKQMYVHKQLEKLPFQIGGTKMS